MMNNQKLGIELIDMEPSEKKTIILWGGDDVLIRAVESVLVAGSDWEVIRISDDCDEDTLSREMERITPNVLIVHESAFTSNMRLLIKFVQDYSRLKIITIGLENNQMEIYDKKTVHIKKTSDLLAAIKNDGAPET